MLLVDPSDPALGKPLPINIITTLIYKQDKTCLFFANNLLMDRMTLNGTGWYNALKTE
jgi:hypothetical protein